MSKKQNTSPIKDLDLIKTNPIKYANEVPIKKLVTVLQKLSDYYYGEKKELITDEIYDQMIDVLKERDPQNLFLFQTGVSKPSKEDVQLPFPMPSLDKMKPGEKSLTNWFTSYHGPYVVSDKLDGISVQIYKDKNGNNKRRVLDKEKFLDLIGHKQCPKVKEFKRYFCR